MTNRIVTSLVCLMLLSATACAEDSNKECLEMTQNGKILMQLSVESVDSFKWNDAYEYIERSFFYLLRASSACEGDYALFAEAVMAEHTILSKKIDCAYHTQQTHAHITQAKQTDFVEDALFHTGWASYHVDEALARCQANPERIEDLMRVRGGLVAFHKRHEND